MDNKLRVLVSLLAILVVFLLGSRDFGWVSTFTDNEFADLVPSLTIPSRVSHEAWVVFEKYLAFAKARDLEGIKSLSFQLSQACQDPARIAECQALMDSIYIIGSTLKESDFPNARFDRHQVVLSSEGARFLKLLVFTRDVEGNPKVLALHFCLEEANLEACLGTERVEEDSDGDGWWDGVEAFFY